MGLSVEGGHRSNVELKSSSATEYVFQYQPHEPGLYMLNIKFGDDYVNGIYSLRYLTQWSYSKREITHYR